ncbi:MAG: hypothetical protein NZ932_04060 [Candidatus Bathyarchaeota archaeon]|nr:hypothetical protein [Candidatus Bathyarchaeota archaeon]MDW8022356.1 hypothetical protein [Nitrososphaerota archaeon]
MDIKLIHDLGLHQIEAGYASNIDGFFFSTLWYMRKKNVYDFVRDIAFKGGLKKAFNIPENVIYIHGSDRPLKAESKDKFRMFIRPPLVSLREAVCFNPDIIQVMDLPLDDGDSEQRVCEKLAINRDMVVEYHNWLVKAGFRSSSRYKNRLPKFSKFMLLGVCHGDYPDAYAEEAKFFRDYCEVLGVPVAGLLARHSRLSTSQRYDYVVQVLTKILDAVGNERVIQLMGFGLSRISELSKILAVAKKYDAVFWFESSTVVRNSFHARKVLSVNIKNPDVIEYVNISKVKGAEKFTPIDVFRENDRVLKGILGQTKLMLS